MGRKEALERFKDVSPPITQILGDKFIDFRFQPKWDIPDKVIIGVAVTGVFINKDQNPAQPIMPDEIRQEFYDCVNRGAVSLHMHVRDSQGRPSCSLESYRAVIDPIRERYGDNVVIDGGCMTGNTFEESVGPVTEGLFDVAIINCTTGLLGDSIRAMPPKTIQAQAEYYRECNVRPMIDVHEASSICNAKRYLSNRCRFDRETLFLALFAKLARYPLYAKPESHGGGFALAC